MAVGKDDINNLKTKLVSARTATVSCSVKVTVQSRRNAEQR